ncbi:hypothetical protein RFI_15472 [Reticulomyxa filosa]|uniref:Uncharacterized protein n=1 Tax=Reticulomyxa filosa TaxID=46433 RepID=X6N6Q0_RETFI|nr:hypothetical protein RFI_15472 [Reticulomyxa filosa]|eukprot:ETO21731.1 hypothetical protein RFI_15472 [Reticulomyxa filosa]
MWKSFFKDQSFVKLLAVAEMIQRALARKELQKKSLYHFKLFDIVLAITSRQLPGEEKEALDTNCIDYCLKQDSGSVLMWTIERPDFKWHCSIAQMNTILTKCKHWHLGLDHWKILFQCLTRYISWKFSQPKNSFFDSSMSELFQRLCQQWITEEATSCFQDKNIGLLRDWVDFTFQMIAFFDKTYPDFQNRVLKESNLGVLWTLQLTAKAQYLSRLIKLVNILSNELMEAWCESVLDHLFFPNCTVFTKLSMTTKQKEETLAPNLDLPVLKEEAILVAVGRMIATLEELNTFGIINQGWRSQQFKYYENLETKIRSYASKYPSVIHDILNANTSMQVEHALNPTIRLSYPDATNIKTKNQNQVDDWSEALSDLAFKR